MKGIIKVLFLLIFVTFFIACSVEDETTPLVKTTGVFGNIPLSGLFYRCSSNEANQTNEFGKFTCNEDDNISFSIGEKFDLGALPVDELITPVTLFKDDSVAALNLMQLLLTLDQDSNPNNGIAIDNTLADKLQDVNISLSHANFDSQIESALNISIVSPEDAYKSFNINFDVDYTRPVITTAQSITTYENQKFIVTLKASDDAKVTFSLDEKGQTDDANFTIESETNKLQFTFFPDYELKNQYELTVYASDGSNINSKKITIDILDIDENPPLINTPKDILVYENQVEVTTIDANDESPLTYSLGGEDRDSFLLDPNNGTLTFKEAPDYEVQKKYSITLFVSDAYQTTTKDIVVHLLDIQEKEIPTLVIIMNWTDYSQNDTSVWHDKIFNKKSKSVAAWYEETSSGELNLFPIHETSGTYNDGIITVDMGVSHPGSSDAFTFRDIYLREAITNSKVVNSVDFSSFDKNKNGEIDRQELQIIFIVAGGEESYGDNPSSSIWAASWSFDSLSAPKVDGVELMKYTGNPTTSGAYAICGATQGDHLATIGIIAHELGHSILNLEDYYDDGGGSGLGWYDIMSGGNWASTPSDTYAGETPTQFSTFNKIVADFDIEKITIDASQELTIKCSSQESIKLKSSKTNEYFLIECRDTTKENSDISFSTISSSFKRGLFALIYHVDDAKDFNGNYLHTNTEDGIQTKSNHYSVAVVEKETSILMTSTEYIEASFSDIYRLGDVVDSERLKLYDGTPTGYSIEVSDVGYSDRTMTFKITK